MPMQVIAINLLGIGEPALFCQQDAERVTGGLHPGPWFVVVHRIVEPHSFLKVLKCPVEIFLSIGDLARNHRSGHRKNLA